MPSVILTSWPLQTPLYDGEHAAGPAPVLFAQDADEATNSLESDVAAAHKDIMKINRKFITYEHVGLTAATLIIKKPRSAYKYNKTGTVKNK